MSATPEIEELLREKSRLKDDLQSLYAEEKHLGQQLRIVEERIAIQELKAKVKAKRVVVEQLKSKLTDLEKRWNAPTVEMIARIAPRGGQQPIQPEHSHMQKVG